MKRKRLTEGALENLKMEMETRELAKSNGKKKELLYRLVHTGDKKKVQIKLEIYLGCRALSYY